MQQKRVLTVDDSSTIRTFIRTVLGNYGALVDEAETGGEGIAQCSREIEYDLILIDLILPDIDGITVLKQIRKMMPKSAIVVLTGVGGVKSAIASLQSDADGYIQKEEISLGDNYDEFVYHLEQAMKRRAGIMAERELEKLKADFYAMVTHDLRNPATTIGLALEVLQEVFADIEDVEVVELMETMRESVDRLLHLINDYLEYAVIESGYLELNREWTDLGPLLMSSIRLAQIQARAKDQQLRVSTEQNLSAPVDGQRMKQVFDNLIGNAIKYTPERGAVHVRLYRQDQNVVFQVEDTGCGLTPQQVDVLFTKYRRGVSRATRAIRGTGLGLPIVKEIVEAHGGAVHARSPGPGCGSTFTVTLPVGEGERMTASVNGQITTR